MEPQVVMAVLMGISLAACAGLRAFLPLFAAGLAARAGIWQVEGWYQWIGSNEALIGFGLATVLEILGDKVPMLDHALDVFHTVARPVAGTLLAVGAFSEIPPMYAVGLGIIVGAPLAGGLHVAKAGTRVASSGMTFGFANPFLSLLEDVIAVVGVLLSVVAPVLALVLMSLLGFSVWRYVQGRKLRRAQKPL